MVQKLYLDPKFGGKGYHAEPQPGKFFKKTEVARYCLGLRFDPATKAYSFKIVVKTANRVY